jgi:ABC-type transport system involved in cytochrome c biogenesis permease subunit
MVKYIWVVQGMIIILTVTVVRSHSFAIKRLGRFAVYSANVLLIMLWCSMILLYVAYFRVNYLRDLALPVGMTSTMGLLAYGVLCIMCPKGVISENDEAFSRGKNKETVALPISKSDGNK